MTDAATNPADSPAPTPAQLAETLSGPLADLPSPLPLAPPTRTRGQAPINATIRPPGSKSLTNRALLLAALADGESVLHRPLLAADDAQRMMAALTTLGVTFDTSTPNTLRIRGTGGRWHNPTPHPPSVPETVLDLNNAGTATRFLAAASMLADHPLVITGNERMRQRPIAELTEALASLGAQIEFLESPGCPPVRITPPIGGLLTTSTLTLGVTQSSQFISALLLVGGCLPAGLTLRLPDGVTSRSYVEMTLALLATLDAPAKSSADLSVIRVDRHVGPFTLEIEPDASGATCFHAAGAILPDATVRVIGPSAEDSLQGDAAFPGVLKQMGCSVITGATKNGDLTTTTRGPRSPDTLKPIMVDMADMPDAVMALAAVAAFTPGTTIVRGVRTLRVKETDRISALQAELAKVGVTVTPNLNDDPDALSITPPPDGIDCSPSCEPVTFDTYDDHRIAMSLSLIALRRPNVLINDPQCVAKTYPQYWAQFAELYR
ncbi:MAG: 3-phosphoshikimate 1-carboxyvinyltransferase [Phycisphaerales bacterium]